MIINLFRWLAALLVATLAGSEPQLETVVKGTIAAAAVINEMIAVIAAQKGFELAGEIKKPCKTETIP